MASRRSNYTYEDAGFNGFFRRTLASNPTASTLRTLGPSGNREIRFDQSQVSGSMGDKFTIGSIVINGVDGRIEVKDPTGKDVGWIGNIEAL